MSDLYKPFDEQSTSTQIEEPIKPNPYEKPIEPIRKQKKSGAVKSFLSMITAGVMGSALTLGAVTYTDYFDFLKAETEQGGAVASEQSSQNGDSRSSSISFTCSSFVSAPAFSATANASLSRKTVLPSRLGLPLIPTISNCFTS